MERLHREGIGWGCHVMILYECTTSSVDRLKLQSTPGVVGSLFCVVFLLFKYEAYVLVQHGINKQKQQQQQCLLSISMTEPA